MCTTDFELVRASSGVGTELRVQAEHSRNENHGTNANKQTAHDPQLSRLASTCAPKAASNQVPSCSSCSLSLSIASLLGHACGVTSRVANVCAHATANDITAWAADQLRTHVQDEHICKALADLVRGAGLPLRAGLTLLGASAYALQITRRYTETRDCIGWHQTARAVPHTRVAAFHR